MEQNDKRRHPGAQPDTVDGKTGVPEKATRGQAPQASGDTRVDQGGVATGAPGEAGDYPSAMPKSPGWSEREGLRARAQSGDYEGVPEAERKLDKAVGPKTEIRGGHSIKAGGNELDDR